MMEYTFSDFKQATIASFLGVLVLLTLRGGNPFFFNPTHGAIISFFVLYIYYKGFNIQNRNVHFIMNVLIAFGVSALLSYIFGLITIEQIKSIEVFGSLVIIATWVSIPVALLADKFNFTNPLKRYFVRR